MEELFKQNLLKLRQNPAPKTFGEALFSSPLWQPQGKNPDKGTHASKILISEEFSEKKQVLESFERFAQEKLEETPAKVIEVEGGEIALKPTSSWEGVPSFNGLHELKSSLSIGSHFLDLLLKGKEPQKLTVLFVTETLRSWEEASSDLKEGFINELLPGFPLKTAELFERMILAMKLLPEEVLLYPVEHQGNDISEEVLQVAGFFKPEVIITLGAKATQKILKTKDRLTLIHGQFFPRALGESEPFQVVPLFHPSIIETNQNMKKTAWADMQKIMKHLKKLS